MVVELDVGQITRGKRKGSIRIEASKCLTEISWGHRAKVMWAVNGEAGEFVTRISYSNRKWEAYCFQSVIRRAIEGCVYRIVGTKPLASRHLSTRDLHIKKDPIGEEKRKARVARYSEADEFYRAASEYVDDKYYKGWAMEG